MEMLLSPASDATLRLMTSPPPAQSATVSAAGGGEDPAREEAPAETKRSPPVFSACVPQATKKQTKRGRPAKADPELWTKEATETLFAVLYVTAKDEFTRARNHVEVGAAWVMVTMLVNKAEEKAYTVLQCKDEIKWLKKKWSLYRAESKRYWQCSQGGPTTVPGSDA
ncbi:uncharacterized protein IUM83_19273 [Phytophthora cinnamomi]|uniref:uncharacterized protein n=1 Tax=Phytophthora cinnamomi TaxID=4785 RepID=UPI0035593777|nr:hypothetical protein IUM83_19273 [Phytophthora cinnamomi]